MPNVDELYSAPWGTYRVHRIDGEQITLQDHGNAGAFVQTSLARFTQDYQPVVLKPKSKKDRGRP